ncbi:DNA translocase FtsK 4TM domain-containing protein [Micrococcus sp. GPGPB33]|uniref:DNA translocase FtsK 4TM domain-containing protein n=1 Tax=Micrococcus sp. GPGPB33 TaxID=3023084 RepID=UPI004040ADA6
MPAVSAVRGSLVGMATRTSPTRSSSSSATSRSGSAGRRGSGRKGSTATVPEADRPAAPLRALHTLWMGLATPVGAGFRKLGPDVRIDREERRDGTGLVLLLLAALIAAVEWWGLRGTAVGRVVHGVVGGTVGWFALLVPIALLVVAVRCFRHATDHRANGRIIIGLLMATVAGSGIAHLVGGVPSAADAFEDMLGAGGMVGYLATAPLASLLTPVPVWVLMILLAFFSVLVLTATPVGSIPQRIAGGYDWLTGQDPEGASEQRAARRAERRRAREERREAEDLAAPLSVDAETGRTHPDHDQSYLDGPAAGAHAAGASRPGLFARLFGGRRAREEQAADAAPEHTASTAYDSPVIHEAEVGSHAAPEAETTQVLPRPAPGEPLAGSRACSTPSRPPRTRGTRAGTPRTTSTRGWTRTTRPRTRTPSRSRPPECAGPRPRTVPSSRSASTPAPSARPPPRPPQPRRRTRGRTPRSPWTTPHVRAPGPPHRRRPPPCPPAPPRRCRR